MSIKIKLEDNFLLFEYKQDDIDYDVDDSDYEGDWIDKVFENNDNIYFKTLNLCKADLYDDTRPKSFIIGKIIDGLVHLKTGVFDITHDFCFDISFPFDFKYFAYTASGLRGSHIPFIKKISDLIKKDIIVSDNDKYLEGIPVKKYINFIENQFPTSYELHLYADKRIEEQIGVFLDIDNSHITKYSNYLERKKTQRAAHSNTLADYEIGKYANLIQELKRLLNMDTLTEEEWQDNIVNIIRLIYPNYVLCLKKLNFDIEGGSKQIDLCLVNADGYIDIIEIKKPFIEGIISERTYRDNHYPLKELSGALMQAEKYIYYLNRGGYELEKKLNNKYSSDLKGLVLKIRNPKGIIIAGNGSSFTQKQQDDFEIIKKKYANIIDIVTYDDLINRLENIIAFLENK